MFQVNIRVLVLGILVAVLCEPAVANAACLFPAETSTCPSPDGSAFIEWRRAGGRHQLLLRTEKDKKTTNVFAFDRGVEVLWSPDSRAFAINERAGSSDSIVWVIEVAAPRRRVNVEEAYKAEFGRPPALYRNGHRYFKTPGWRSASSLDIDIEANDDGEFHDHVLYHLNGSIERN